MPGDHPEALAEDRQQGLARRGVDLDLPTASGTAQGRMKKISRLTVRVKDSRGLQAGTGAAALRPW